MTTDLISYCFFGSEVPAHHEVPYSCSTASETNRLVLFGGICTYPFVIEMKSVLILATPQSVISLQLLGHRGRLDFRRWDGCGHCRRHGRGRGYPHDRVSGHDDGAKNPLFQYSNDYSSYQDFHYDCVIHTHPPHHHPYSQSRSTLARSTKCHRPSLCHHVDQQNTYHYQYLSCSPYSSISTKSAASNSASSAPNLPPHVYCQPSGSKMASAPKLAA